MKIITDARHGEILGVHIVGPSATELVGEAVMAMQIEATARELATVSGFTQPFQRPLWTQPGMLKTGLCICQGTNS